jgi:hypothetical protein
MGGRATAAPPGEAVDDDKVESWGRAAVVDKDDEMLLEDVEGGELGDESPSIDGV